MPRPTRQELDDEILERAAMLFASHGFKETSVQRIADAVGYSKTGLLHRYPSKEALQAAVIARCVADMRAVSAGASGLPPGAGRDRAVLTDLARLAVRRPGFVALMLSLISTAEPAQVMDRLQDIGTAVFAGFAVNEQTDQARRLRVIGALGALAVACLSLPKLPLADAAEQLAALGYDTLGHRPDPADPSGHRPDPADLSGHRPDPAHTSGHRPDPAR